MNKTKIKQYLNRGISTPAGLFVILIFLLIVGAAILWEVKFGCPSSILPSPSPTPAPPAADETADWEIYTSEEYGFEIKYPPILMVEKSKQEEKIIIGNEASPYYFIFIRENIFSPNELRNIWEDEFDILIGLIGVPPEELDWPPEITWKDVVLPSGIAIQMSHESFIGPSGIIHRTGIINKGRAYTIETSGYFSEEDQYDQILSTFKFID